MPWDEVGPGVFRRRYASFDLNVAAVVASDGVLVVDTRASPREAQELLDDLRHLSRRPARWVVNTHWHVDHTLGNALFPLAEIWGHPSVPAMLAQRGAAAAVELVGAESEGAEPVAPSRFVATSHWLDLGDRGVELRHLGRAHTDGDVVVVVPEAGVVLAGDLVEQSGPPAYGDDSYPLEWPATLARVGELLGAGSAVVPGHGDVVDRKFVCAQLEGLEAVARALRELHGAGIPLAEALEAGRDRWPWPASTLVHAVERGYRQLGPL